MKSEELFRLSQEKISGAEAKRNSVATHVENLENKSALQYFTPCIKTWPSRPPNHQINRSSKHPATRLIRGNHDCLRPVSQSHIQAKVQSTHSYHQT